MTATPPLPDGLVDPLEEALSVAGKFSANNLPLLPDYAAKVRDELAKRGFKITPPAPVAKEGLAERICNALWPILGGDMQPAEVWQDISDAVFDAAAAVQQNQGLVEQATGYSDAFYTIGKMLGIPAQSKSPTEVWATQMRPRLEALVQQEGAYRSNGVYLAARFSRRHECHALAKALQEQGYRITNWWVKPEADHVLPTGISAQAADDERRRFATEDVADVRAANWTISLMEEPRSNTRGGRHIEFGIALALGHRLTIIGPRETVFHHLPQVEHFDTAEQFRQALTQSNPENHHG